MFSGAILLFIAVSLSLAKGKLSWLRLSSEMVKEQCEYDSNLKNYCYVSIDKIFF